MWKLLIGFLAALGMTGPVNASVIISENFENGLGVFTSSGQVGIATGADYQDCCNTTGNTTNHFVAFGSGNQLSGNITSSPFSTVLGETYTVTLDYGALGTGGEALSLFIEDQFHNGVLLHAPAFANNNLDATFTTFSFPFLGTGFDMTVFAFSDGINNVDFVLDNFRISNATLPIGDAVPEPSTWTLLLLGFAAIGLAVRRGKKSLVARQAV